MEEEVTQGEEKQVALKRFIQPKSTRWLCQLGEVDLLVFVFSSDTFPSAQTLQCFRITIEELAHHLFGLNRSDTSKNIYTKVMGANCCRLGAQNSVRPEKGLVVDGQMRTTSSQSLGGEGGR